MPVRGRLFRARNSSRPGRRPPLGRSPITASVRIAEAVGSLAAKNGPLRAVIETPKGSRAKYAFDTERDAFELATVLSEGIDYHRLDDKTFGPLGIHGPHRVEKL